MKSSAEKNGEISPAPSSMVENWTILGMILAAGAPFSLALIIFHLLGPERGPAIGLVSLTEGYIPGLIGFCTVVIAQVVACLGAIYIFARILGRSPEKIQRQALLIGVPFGITILLVLALMPDYGGAAGRLTFRFFGDIFALSGADWLYVDNGNWMPSRLFLAYYLPSAFGVIAVITAAMALATVVQQIPPSNSKTWTAALKESYATAKQVLYLLTLILVLSTFAASLFFHLPVEALPQPERANMARFASELSTFWGTVYTLTLITTIAPAILLLEQKKQHGIASLTDSKAAADTKTLLNSSSLITGLKQQIELVLALLAPIITGSLANAFHTTLTIP